jgi:hypothetical protein
MYYCYPAAPRHPCSNGASCCPTADPVPTPVLVQVSEVKWVGLQELQKQMEIAPSEFTPWFTGEVWQVLR